MPTTPRVASDAALRVVYIAEKMLSPNTDGASLRIFKMIRVLRKLNCRVSFLVHRPQSFPPYDETLAEDTAILEALGVEVPELTDSTSVLQHLRQSGRHYDVAMFTPYPVACRYLQPVRRHAPRAIAVYNALDLGHLQLFRHARLTGNVPVLKRAIEAKQQETWLAEHCDCTLVCSEDEQAILLDLCPGADVRVASHVVERHRSTAGFADRNGLMFLGSFPHVANVDAMLYFVDDILPAIRRAIPDITVDVVGAEPPQEVTALATRQITVTGRVPDLNTYFTNNRVFVAPLRHGAGIKIKILESLGRGIPTVLTSVAAEGLHLTDGVDTLIADSPDDFAEAVIRLYRDEDLWRRVAAAGFALIEKHFSWSTMEATLRGVLELATDRG